MGGGNYLLYARSSNHSSKDPDRVARTIAFMFICHVDTTWYDMMQLISTIENAALLYFGHVNENTY